MQPAALILSKFQLHIYSHKSSGSVSCGVADINHNLPALSYMSYYWLIIVLFILLKGDTNNVLNVKNIYLEGTKRTQKCARF